MHQAGDQAVDLVQRKHHGADHHRVFQLLLSHRRIEVLAFAQVDHRLDIAPANQLRVKDFQVRRQGDPLRTGHRFDFLGLGQQHAPCDAARLADRSRLHQQRLGAFGQDNAFVGLLRPLYQLVAEHRRRQAQLTRRTAALVQPCSVEVAGDKIGDEFGALTVVHRDLAVE
ncbi:hypothetical protein D3C78_957990 [compost metagenome]